MVLDAVANFVRGTSTESINDSQTTIPVDDASIFPDPSVQGEFNVVIWDANNFPRPDQDTDVEIMRVTARDTTADELTVTRGQEMTSAAAHPEGSAIHLSPTAKMFSDIESTFGDFWDDGTQELTADVNNTNTTTQALEAGSVSTGESKTDFQRLHRSAIQEGSISVEEIGDFDAKEIGGVRRFQATSAVSTGGKEIFTRAPPNDRGLNYCGLSVLGRKHDGSGGLTAVEFLDELRYVVGDGTVRPNPPERGAPADRSYSFGTDGVTLSISADTYDVLVIATGFQILEQI